MGLARLAAEAGFADRAHQARTVWREPGFPPSALRAELREHGLARAAEFSWERTAAATLAVYREAVGQ